MAESNSGLAGAVHHLQLHLPGCRFRLPVHIERAGIAKIVICCSSCNRCMFGLGNPASTIIAFPAP